MTTPTAYQTNKAFVDHIVVKKKQERFYGKVTLIYEDGLVKRVIEEKSIIAPSFKG